MDEKTRERYEYALKSAESWAKSNMHGGPMIEAASGRAEAWVAIAREIRKGAK